MYMKKYASLLLASVLTLGLFGGHVPAANAAAAPKSLVYVDSGSRSYLPLRALNGFAGMTAVLNPANGQIQIVKGDTSLTLTKGSKSATVNGKPSVLREAPFTGLGTTFVPVSAVAAPLGITVKWNRETGSALLTIGKDSLELPVHSGSLSALESSPVVVKQQTLKAAGRSFSVRTVTVSLLNPNVSLGVALAGDQVGRTEALGSLAKRHQAAAAVNGTFFDAYTSSSFKAPYGYLVNGGRMLKDSPGDRRAVFTYDRNHLARLIPGTEFDQRFDAGLIYGAVQAGPRLLTDGKVSIDVKTEGFRDPKILTGGGARSALGLTRDHKLILLTTGGATIPQLAQIMKSAGAYQAMNLDGGASSGLYAGGKYLTTPGRLISNALIVKTQ